MVMKLIAHPGYCCYTSQQVEKEFHHPCKEDPVPKDSHVCSSIQNSYHVTMACHNLASCYGLPVKRLNSNAHAPSGNVFKYQSPIFAKHARFLHLSDPCESYSRPLLKFPFLRGSQLALASLFIKTSFTMSCFLSRSILFGSSWCSPHNQYQFLVTFYHNINFFWKLPSIWIFWSRSTK